MKVLHLPTSVGGMGYGLSRGERALGLTSDVLTVGKNWIDYPSDIVVDVECSRFNRNINLFKALLKIRKKYDVYHFNFGSTLINLRRHPNFDLYFYSGKSKKIMTYNGCDARQKFLTMEKYDFSACHNPDCYGGMCKSVENDLSKRNRIDYISKYMDHIFYVNPDLKSFLPDNSSFLPYAVALWDKINFQKRKCGYPLRIVHAPTNRGAKGSVEILQCMNRLIDKYPGKIDFKIIENMKNSDAIGEYERADLVIDQIYIGWYGGLAVEAMKAGAPVAVFIREEDLVHVPLEMAYEVKETFININPKNMYDQLSYYIENPNELKILSEKATDYVHKWHDPKYVASITKSIYERA